MEPRPNRRGNAEGLALALLHLKRASMEPRPNRRGNAGTLLTFNLSIRLQWSHVLTDVETTVEALIRPDPHGFNGATS